MFIRSLWPATLWSLLTLSITLIPGNALPESDIFQLDKLVHLFFFGVLMILVCYGFIKENSVFHSQLAAGMYCVAFGMLIETLQQFVPGRTFSWVDMAANSLGVGLGYLCFVFLKSKNWF